MKEGRMPVTWVWAPWSPDLGNPRSKSNGSEKSQRHIPVAGVRTFLK